MATGSRSPWLAAALPREQLTLTRARTKLAAKRAHGVHWSSFAVVLYVSQFFSQHMITARRSLAQSHNKRVTWDNLVLDAVHEQVTQPFARVPNNILNRILLGVTGAK